MLSATDFCWTCIAIDYPWFSFQLDSNGVYNSSGMSEIRVEVLYNADTEYLMILSLLVKADKDTMKEVPYDTYEFAKVLLEHVKPMINQMKG